MSSIGLNNLRDGGKLTGNWNKKFPFILYVLLSTRTEVNDNNDMPSDTPYLSLDYSEVFST